MDRNSFRWIRHAPLPGAWNMAFDEALMGGDTPPAPALRVYAWEPWTLSLGRFQSVDPPSLDAWLDAGYDVTRRSTGGGAILHARELTYSLVLPAGDPRVPRATAAAYDWIHGAVAEALAGVGVTAAPRGAVTPPEGPDPFFCFRRTAAVDLVTAGRKLVGSAQRRTRTAFLQHGSVPLVADPTAPEAASVLGLVGGDLAGVRARIEDAMATAFERLLAARAVPSAPTAEEGEAAARAALARYGRPAWVFGVPRGGGRRAPVPPPPAPSPAGAPLRLLRAAVTDDGLRILAEAGGARDVLPHARLHRVDALAGSTPPTPSLAAAVDPWESTFRRSYFPPEGDVPPAATAAAGGIAALPPAGPAGPPTAARIVWVDPVRVALLDARRFHFGDLGADRTGDPARDLRCLVGRLLARAPSALAPDWTGDHAPPAPPRAAFDCLPGALPRG